MYPYRYHRSVGKAGSNADACHQVPGPMARSLAIASTRRRSMVRSAWRAVRAPPPRRRRSHCTSQRAPMRGSVRARWASASARFRTCTDAIDCRRPTRIRSSRKPGKVSVGISVELETRTRRSVLPSSGACWTRFHRGLIGCMTERLALRFLPRGFRRGQQRRAAMRRKRLATSNLHLDVLPGAVVLWGSAARGLCLRPIMRATKCTAEQSLPDVAQVLLSQALHRDAQSNLGYHSPALPQLTNASPKSASLN